MSGASSAISVEVAVSCPEWRRACPSAAAIAAEAGRRALGAAGEAVPTGVRIVLGVTLADDAEQQRLNRAYRGQDRPTNVLAFPTADPAQMPPPGAPLLLGDVVLALETVAREALEQQKSLDHHLSHLVVHGVLHLLGYDHQSEVDAVAMEARETEILAALGVPDPFRDII